MNNDCYKRLYSRTIDLTFINGEVYDPNLFESHPRGSAIVISLVASASVQHVEFTYVNSGDGLYITLYDNNNDKWTGNISHAVTYYYYTDIESVKQLGTRII